MTKSAQILFLLIWLAISNTSSSNMVHSEAVEGLAMSLRPIKRFAGFLIVHVLLVAALVGCEREHATGATPLALPPRPAVPSSAVIFTYQWHTERDVVVEEAYRKLDAEISATFDYETGHQRYAGHADDLFGTIDIRTGERLSEGNWTSALRARDGYISRLDALIELEPSLHWMLLALARHGSLSYSMMQGLATLEERGFTVLGPRETATFAQLAQLGNQPSPTNWPYGPNDVHEMKQKLLMAFDAERSKQLSLVGADSIRAYAWAAALAKHYQVSDAVTNDICQRLVILRRKFDPDFETMLERAIPFRGIAGVGQRLSSTDLGVRAPCVGVRSDAM